MDTETKDQILEGYLMNKMESSSNILDFETGQMKEDEEKDIENIHVRAPRQIFKCSYCNYAAKWKGGLKYHMRIHSNFKVTNYELSSVINLDDLKFDSLSLSDKNSLPSKVKRIKCSDCTYETKYDFFLKIHSVKHMDDNLLKCPECKTEFKNRYDVVNHLHENHLPKISKTKKKSPSQLSCPLNQGFNLEFDKFHSAPFFTCSECGYETHCVNRLKNHAKIHVDEVIICPICSLKFAHRNQLKEHILEHIQITSPESAGE